ncbi:hypothetical protein [Proteus cibi]|uniref:hypothetical protein n=1 Tax=Proteus cibi TaxID=2050966 RepID=UPI0035A6A131
MDCPFLTENKYGKEMMEAYRSGDFGRAKKYMFNNVLYSKPAGKGSDVYPNTIYRPVDINARLTPEA